MKIKILTLALPLALFAANANAGTLMDVYVGATIGAGAATLFADGQSNTDTAQSYGAMIGLDIPLIRLEAEYNYLNDIDTRLNLGMVNAYFKMPATVILPYLGLGVGSVFGGKSDNVDINANAAYQGMLGVTFDTPALPLKIDLEGRVLYAPNIYNINGVRPDLLHYDARVKLRYVF